MHLVTSVEECWCNGSLKYLIRVLTQAVSFSSGKFLKRKSPATRGKVKPLSARYVGYMDDIALATLGRGMVTALRAKGDAPHTVAEFQGYRLTEDRHPG
jgi:hypothetical protein